MVNLAAVMRRSILYFCAQIATKRPGAVLWTAIAITLLCGSFIPKLTVEAGHSAMVDPNEDYQKRFDAFLNDYGSPSQLVVLIEGSSEKNRRRLVSELSQELPENKPDAESRCSGSPIANNPGCVRSVMGKIDLDSMAQNGLWFLPSDMLEKTVGALTQPRMGLSDLYEINSIETMLAKIRESMEAGLEGEAPEEINIQIAQDAMKGLTAFLEALNLKILGTERRPLLEVFLGDQRIPGMDIEGYFSSSDGALKIALIRPVNESDDPLVVNPFVGYVRSHANQLVRKINTSCAEDKSCGESPLQITLTGIPALVAEESEVLAWDALLMSVVATLGILGVFLFGFYSFRQAILGLCPMLLSIIISLGLVQIIYGRLNILTSGFVGMLLGLGVAFSIHLLSRYKEARSEGQEHESALEQALLGAGPGIMTGGFTTIGAFLALFACDFKAFSELGVITSVGLTVSMVLTLTVLPAMLCHPRLSRLRAIPPSSRKLARVFSGLQAVPTFVTQNPKKVISTSVLTTALLLIGVQNITWSYDYLEMLPANLPAVEGMKKISANPDFSTEMVAIEASSIEEAGQFAAALKALPSVARVESLASYIPTDQARKREIIRALKPTLAEAGTPKSEKPVNTGAILDEAQELLDVMEDARFEARRGTKAEQALLDGPHAAIKKLLNTLSEIEEENLKNLKQTQKELIELRNRGLKVIAKSVEATGVSAKSMLAQMPPGLQDRLHHDGRFAVYAYPAKPIWNKEDVQALIADVRSVHPDATGFPVQHYEVNSAVERGFKEASLLVVIALLVLVFLDFRDPRYTVLAMLPLGMGLAWTWGLFSLAGMHYTAANIIAFPLILGIAIDSGVHILHRYRQEQGEKISEIVRYTGKAILLSGFTTMAGFGALTTASHRGAQSIGFVLLMGTSTGLVAAIMVLPALLKVTGLRTQRDNRK